MRKLHAIITRFLAGLSCLLLGACFDIREEVWIHRDGSGRAELSYTVPENALRLAGGATGLEANIREIMATQPKIRLDDLDITVAGGRAKIAARLSTDSMLSLLDLKESESFQNMSAAATDIAGAFDVRLKGLDVDFTRTVRIREALGLGSLVDPAPRFPLSRSQAAGGGERDELRRSGAAGAGGNHPSSSPAAGTGRGVGIARGLRPRGALGA